VHQLLRERGQEPGVGCDVRQEIYKSLAHYAIPKVVQTIRTINSELEVENEIKALRFFDISRVVASYKNLVEKVGSIPPQDNAGLILTPMEFDVYIESAIQAALDDVRENLKLFK